MQQCFCELTTPSSAGSLVPKLDQGRMALRKDIGHNYNGLILILTGSKLQTIAFVTARHPSGSLKKQAADARAPSIKKWHLHIAYPAKGGLQTLHYV